MRKRGLNVMRIDLWKANFKYLIRDLCRLGPRKAFYGVAGRLLGGIYPSHEVWGFSRTARRLYNKYFPANPWKARRVRHLITKHQRLNIGCGGDPLPDWINQDWQPGPGVDLVCDARRLGIYVEEGSLDAILISHVLEHFLRSETEQLTALFYRMLKPGGKLWIAVPDLNVLCALLNSQEDPNAAALTANLIATPEPGHVSVWVEKDLTRLLLGQGYRTVERWPDDDMLPFVSKGCWSVKIDSTPISLNVIATK